jgi:protein-tyrosine-phosphatase
MAAALLERQGGDRVSVASAGITPAERISPIVVEAMAEIGLDISSRRPAPLDDEQAGSATLIVTMGCGDACPIYPNVRRDDWDVPDPSGKELEEVRQIRDVIAMRVETLRRELRL